MELKKVGVWSFAKITTVFGLIGGIIAVIFLAIMQELLENVPLDTLQQIGMNPVALTLTTILGTLVSYTLSGFIIGLVIALIYNFLAKYIGGIKIDLKK